jgi:hypothetical protein
MISRVRAYGTGYIMRRQVCRKGLLHHEKAGCPSAPNLVTSGARSEGINGGDDDCSRLVVGVLLKGKGGKNTWIL